MQAEVVSGWLPVETTKNWREEKFTRIMGSWVNVYFVRRIA
jgi:hypothetical protein